MTNKKKLIVISIITAVLIAAIVIALLCLGKAPGAVPEATESTVSTDPTAAPTEGSTTPPTAGATSPADPTETVDPSMPTNPTGTTDPSAPTDASEPSAPTSGSTAQPTQSATQKPTQAATQKPTQAATQKPTQAATQKPTQAATQATTPGVQLKITTPDDTVIYPGDKLQLEYIYTGNKKLTWSHSFDDIFTVDQNGLITATGGGSTIVKVTDGDITSRIYITVQSIIVNTPAHTAISVGETLKIDYKYLGKAQPMTWTSSDPDVLTVDKNGVVTGIRTGVSTVTVEDKHYMQRFCIYVAADEDKTTSISLALNAPLYDGVNKIVGNYVQIGQLNSVLRNDSGEQNNIVDEWHASGRESDPSTPDPFYPCRNYYITSSNPDVISIENKFDCGFYDDFLYFNKPGKAVITVTTWDGYSESYTVNVKKDYDCAPGKEKLTPSEYAYYASMACYEESGLYAHQLSAYLYQYLTEDEITWTEAKETAFFVANREFQLGQRLAPMVIYAGLDEKTGMHLFFIGGGGTGAGYEKYDPPAGSDTGHIRFPGTQLTMLERSGLLLEVLGDTSNGLVTYTSSDPSVVIASGGFLLAQKEGTAVVTATYNGQETWIDVTVERDPEIQRITLETDLLRLSQWDISGRIVHCTYFYWEELTCYSSNPAVATAEITNLGHLKVFPGRPGECVITVTDGVNSATCTIIVSG